MNSFLLRHLWLNLIRGLCTLVNFFVNLTNCLLRSLRIKQDQKCIKVNTEFMLTLKPHKTKCNKTSQVPHKSDI